jgi:ABC-2 type transport system permease protein
MSALALRQVHYERLAWWRNRRRVFFTFGLPLMFLVLLGALYSGTDGPDGRSYLSYFVPGILAYGVISSTFVSVAAVITQLREDGVLKRVRGTPIPAWAYLAGHVGCVVLSALGVTVLALAVGDLAYGVAVPWHAMPGVLVTVLVAALAFTALGFAVVRLIKSADSGPAIVNFLLLPLTFISGIWGPPVDDRTLARIADLFPVRMLADALQHAYDPGVHGAGLVPHDLLGLAAWGVAGFVLARRFMRAEAANG